MSEWCITVGSADYGYDQCVSPYFMVLIVVVELGFYLLVGSGLWGIFKRIQARKRLREEQRRDNKNY